MDRQGARGVLGALLLGVVLVAAPGSATSIAAPPAADAATAASRAAAVSMPSSTVIAMQKALTLLAHPVPLTGTVDLSTRKAVGELVEKYDWPVPEADGGVDGVVARRIIELAQAVAATPTACRGATVLCIDQDRWLLLVVDHDRIVERHDVRLGDSPSVNRAGRFRVVRKADRAVSSAYGAVMLDALFFDGGRALHFSQEFARDGYAGSSHGCVNLRDALVARRLFTTTVVGTPVVVLADTHVATSAETVADAMRAAGLTADTALAISVRDLVTGRETVLGARRAVRPASNAKLLTATAALSVLGPGHRFTSRVRLSSHHRLVVVGGGDPDLSAEDAAALGRRTARALQRRGVTHVRLGADLSAFATVPLPVGWPASATGDLVGRLSPLRIAGQHAGAGWPAVLRVVRRELHRAGVVSRLVRPAPAPRGSSTLARHRSPTVDDLVGDMLLNSVSDTAETLRAHVIRARGSDRDAVVRAVAALGADMRGVTLADGSGLSARDRVTAHAMTDLLAALQAPSAPPGLRGVLGQLPVAGRSGTLGPGSARFVSPSTRCAAGRAAAKTGTLGGLVVLSGYARDLGRHLIAFSIVVDRAGASHRGLVTAVDAGVVAVVQCG